jgi:hypothetical protein
MFGKISYTFSLMGASWEVLRKDKELLVFPILSGICCLLVTASFAVPIFASGALEGVMEAEEGAEATGSVFYYVVLGAFYLCSYFVIFFFNAAVIACALIRMKGGDPTVGDGLRAAFSRIHLVFGWALLSATVGLVLRIIEDRSKAVGAIVAGILGMAWTVVTFLAVPVLVVEKVGPITALKRSTQMLRHTWGEQLIGGFSFGIIFFLLGLLAAVPVVLGALAGSAALVAGIILAVIYLLLLALVQSVLYSIFRAALYLYASEGTAAEGFDVGLLNSAMTTKA